MLHISLRVALGHTFVLVGLHVLYVSIHLEIQQLLVGFEQLFTRVDVYHAQLLDPVEIGAEILAIILHLNVRKN